MRLSAFFFAMILTCPAGAAEWKEFLSPDHSFTVHFPTDPNIEMTAYHTPDGRSFSAHVYSAAQETGIFTLTVAEVPETGNQVQEDALMSDAVEKMTEGGLIKFDIQHRIRWFYGRQLGIAGVNGGYSYVAVFHHNNRLYQIEGKAFVAADRRKSMPCVSNSRWIFNEPNEPAGMNFRQSSLPQRIISARRDLLPTTVVCLR